MVPLYGFSAVVFTLFIYKGDANIVRRDGVAPHLYVVRGYKDCCSDGMNKIRKAFGDNGLTWDDQLAQDAENWALTQAIQSPFSNGKPSKTENGENLFWQQYVREIDKGNALKCYNALWYWYKERDPASADKGLVIQLVGERVKKFGIGVAVNMRTKTIYFVGRFDYNMPIDKSLWNYFAKKERWVLKKENLKSDEGTLSYSCRNINREEVPCSTRQVNYMEIPERIVL